MLVIPKIENYKTISVFDTCTLTIHVRSARATDCNIYIGCPVLT